MWEFKYVLLNTKNCVWTLHHLPGGIETETELRQFCFFLSKSNYKKHVNEQALH